MDVRPVFRCVVTLFIVTAACSSPRTDIPDPSGWLVIDPGGKGIITCQKNVDEVQASDSLTCETKNMEIRNQGRTLSRWTIRLNRITGEPCCRAELPCCSKADPGCPCELFDLMRAKNVLPKQLSHRVVPGHIPSEVHNVSCANTDRGLS